MDLAFGRKDDPRQVPDGVLVLYGNERQRIGKRELLVHGVPTSRIRKAKALKPSDRLGIARAG
jgi:hypothetical protein